MFKRTSAKKNQFYEVKKPSLFQKLFRKRKLKNLYRLDSGQIAMF